VHNSGGAEKEKSPQTIEFTGFFRGPSDWI
jgi:hypothetical protein